MEKKLIGIKNNLESNKQKDINFGVLYALEFLRAYEDEEKTIFYNEMLNYELTVLSKKINFSVKLISNFLYKICYTIKEKEYTFFIDLNDLLITE